MNKVAAMKSARVKSCIYSALIAIGVLGASVPVTAHHAFTMFDSDKLLTMSGTITKYSFQMPHVWFYLMTSAEGKAAEEWGFEMGSPNLAVRNGWGTKSLHPGDKVTVSFHPMRDGSKAGSVVSVTMADGRVLWNGKPPGNSK
jgi:Family of unknown function (DUF6152)